MCDLPHSVLFACSLNAVRSPMAEGLLKHLLGHRICVDSVGVRAGAIDPFAAAVMEEIGIDLSKHCAKAFDALSGCRYDLVVSLSPAAQHCAVTLTRTMAWEVEFWRVLDPSLIQGTRETRLQAYREIRDQLLDRIKHRFGAGITPAV